MSETWEPCQAEDNKPSAYWEATQWLEKRIWEHAITDLIFLPFILIYFIHSAEFCLFLFVCLISFPHA